MKISQILNNKKITVSCELFPPKVGEQLPQSRIVAAETAKLKPDFISVTYGAAGSTAGFTAELAEEIESCGIPALAHITCVSSDERSLADYLGLLKNRGIENILALRGDMPAGSEPKKVYRYASDLAAAIKKAGGFCIGGACYPEKHPESSDVESDIEALKIKAEAGCEFFTTQMFFDNSKLYSFLDKLRKKGINTPVIAGIMPITNAKQVSRSVALSGTSVTKELADIVSRFGDDPAAMRAAGIAYATNQMTDLLANGVNNLHIYTMNKPDIAKELIDNISEMVK